MLGKKLTAADLRQEEQDRIAEILIAYRHGAVSQLDATHALVKQAGATQWSTGFALNRAKDEGDDGEAVLNAMTYLRFKGDRRGIPRGQEEVQLGKGHTDPPGSR